jgi:hypothetical protein
LGSGVWQVGKGENLELGGKFKGGIGEKELEREAGGR